WRLGRLRREPTVQGALMRQAFGQFQYPTPPLAVFQDDLVRTYRGFLDRRRADRPQEEYREPTEQEWHDFQQHFELRKVSLGTCGRPYGTPCKHEHACIRCPVLQLDPRQKPRLIEIIQNLRERIREARANGWLGEVEGLQVSLDAATAKLTSLNRTRADGRPQLVNLGMPLFTDTPPTAGEPPHAPDTPDFVRLPAPQGRPAADC
ncbi:hypothetical protein ACIRYZ_42435, partial [Kitasatospora sp. NPDC101155]